ncbi:MAG: hypothetical protein LBF97_02920 [Elusimicrobiota bacterium]|jgi:DNA-binding phage protein|nr:hypothetical protein [Elusimicrobiota bacterium]
MKNQNKLITFDDVVLDTLKKNPEYLEAFIKNSIEEYKITKNLQLFLRDIKLISLAKKGGISNISKKASIDRKTIYNIFDNKNFSFNNFSKFLNILDIDITFSRHQVSK